MPMPMRRHVYPQNWEAVALAVKTSADWRCQLCGVQCRRPGEPFDTHRRTLTVAHVDHDPGNVNARLVALCSGCHLRHDAPRKARERRSRT